MPNFLFDMEWDFEMIILKMLNYTLVCLFPTLYLNTKVQVKPEHT